MVQDHLPEMPIKSRMTMLMMVVDTGAPQRTPCHAPCNPAGGKTSTGVTLVPLAGAAVSYLHSVS